MNSSFYQRSFFLFLSLEEGHFKENLGSTKLAKIKNDPYGTWVLIGKQAIIIIFWFNLS